MIIPPSITSTSRDLSTIATGDAIPWASAGCWYRNEQHLIAAVLVGGVTLAYVPSALDPTSLAALDNVATSIVLTNNGSPGALQFDVTASALNWQGARIADAPITFVITPSLALTGGIAGNVHAGGLAVDPLPPLPLAPTANIQITRGLYRAVGGTPSPSVGLRLEAPIAGVAQVFAQCGSVAQSFVLAFA